MGVKARLLFGALAVSASGLAFITGQEGRVYEAYPDPALGWSVPTICDGHTGQDVKRGLVANDAMCDALRSKDAAKWAGHVSRCVTYRPLNQNQVDSLISFTHNVGPTAMCSSTLVRKLNTGDFQGAADEFPRWVYAGKTKLRGLVKRRDAERAMFLTP